MYDSLKVYGFTAYTNYFGNAGHNVFDPNAVNKQKIFSEIKS